MTEQPGITSQETKQRKIALRKQILEERDKLTADERADKSAIICGKLQNLYQRMQLMFEQQDVSREQNGQRKAVLSYLPFRSEVDVLPFLRWCWEHRITVAVPRTQPEERRMTFHRIRSLEDTEVTSPYGIREPHPSLDELSDPSLVGLIIVPGAVFDADGRRIGYGGGYYDRFLADFAAVEQRPIGTGPNRRPPLVAPCFDLQITDTLPSEPHDITMDIILTEHREIVARDWY